MKKTINLLCASACLVGTMANAKTLKEALEDKNFLDINYNGMVYVRHDNIQRYSTAEKDNETVMEFYLDVNVPLSDDLDVTVGLEAYPDYPVSNNNGNSFSDSKIKARRAFFNYTNDKLNLKVGQQNLGLPVTMNMWGGEIGTGAIASYTKDNYTFFAQYFGGISDADSSWYAPFHLYDSNFSLPYEANEAKVTAAGVKAAFGPANINLNVLKARKFIDNMVYSDIFVYTDKFDFTARYTRTKLDEGVSQIAILGAQDGADDTTIPGYEPAIANGETGDFYTARAKGKFDLFSIGAGFSKNDDKQGINSYGGAFSEYDQEANEIAYPGVRMQYEIDNKPGVDAYFTNVDVPMGDFLFKAGYSTAKFKNEDKKMKEFWGQLHYFHKSGTIVTLSASKLDDDTNQTGILDRDQELIGVELTYLF